MEDTVFNKMSKIADKVIKHYKTDFTQYDVLTYGRMYENTTFIWIVRKCGTYICGIAKDCITVSEERKNDIRENAKILVNHYMNEGYDKTVRFYHVSKNRFIKKINADTALKLVSQ